MVIRQGEYLYLGVHDYAGTPCLIWQQYTQPVTRNAMMLAQDVEKGDTVTFYQNRPIVTRGNERDLGPGRSSFADIIVSHIPEWWSR